MRLRLLFIPAALLTISLASACGDKAEQVCEFDGELFDEGDTISYAALGGSCPGDAVCLETGAWEPPDCETVTCVSASGGCDI